MKGRMDRRKRLRRLAAALSLVLAGFGFLPTGAAHPTGHTESAGVTISGTSDMNITSTAANNVIQWEAFSIATGEKVAFDAHNYLNYVTGNARSDIYGTLTGSGSIYLINPNGILIGDGAAINVGSLYLSTRNLSEDALNAFSTGGTNPLLTAGTVSGDVINLGKLNATHISVEGNNITFKNVADVTTGGVQNNNVTMNASGEIHIGSASGSESAYSYTINSGTKIDYKLVSNATELQNMQGSGNYMLANDISGVTIESNKVINNHTGRFDGLNHKLSNLTIKLGNYAYGGLFRMNSGTIENLEINGITFKDTDASQESFNAIGAVVGINAGTGTIKNVRNTGSMTFDISQKKVRNIGGIAGINQGTIENASNSANISYNNVTYNVGGISGYNDDTGIIKNVSNRGAIAGADSRQVGGIVGSNYSGGKIEGASNTGNVTGNGTTGSIAGSNDGTINVDDPAAPSSGGNDDGSSGGNNSGNTTPSAPGSSGGSSGARSGGAAASVMVPSVPAPTTSADTATAPAVAPTTPAPAALPGNATAIDNSSSAIVDAHHPSQANVEAVPAFLAAIAEAEAVAATATAGTEREMARMAEAGALGNAPSFTMAAGGLLALSSEVNSAPRDAMSVESFGHALSAAQHGSAENSAAAPGALTEASDRSGRMSEAIAATDLAIGTEIAETDRESGSGQANASDSDTADNGKGEQAS